MKIPSFLKKKRTYAILLILLTIGWFATRGAEKASGAYETATVTTQQLVRTVEVTGEVTPAQRVELTFQEGGVVAAIHKKVGDSLKAGDLVMELERTELQFALRRAEAARDAAAANLQLRLAGETPQAIRVAETEVDKAQVALEKSQSDLANLRITTVNDIRTAELTVATAKHNWDNGARSDAQDTTDALEDLRTALATALGPLQTGFSDGDKVIGVDDNASNSGYRNVLSIADSSALLRAQDAYKATKPAKTTAETSVRALSSASTRPTVITAAASTDAALALMQTFLTEVQKVLGATIASSNLTEAELAAKKAQIDADRASVSAQRAAVANAIQAVNSAEQGATTSGNNLENAYQTAVLALEIAKSNAETHIRAGESAVAMNTAARTAAEALRDLKRADPRGVDLAPLHAALADAQAAYEQAEYRMTQRQITAPADGVVSEILPALGERVAPNTPVVRMVGLSAYDIEVLLPESDVVKVQVGQAATVTLDAYGDATTFTGTVVSEEPDQTVVQDAVYYKARIQLADIPSENGTPLDIKPGMTANVTVRTAEAADALVIPSRSVRTDQATGVQTVRVLVGETPEERTITTGLRGDEGLLQVLSGLTANETVIVSERTR